MKQGIYMRALAEDATEAVIDIVGVIGWEVWYEQMRDMLRSIPESISSVVFEIYSPGGDVWEGNGIIQEIGELNQRVHTVANVQVAASMATLIAVACKERVMAKNGRWLIHNPWSSVQGDAAEMEKMAKSLRDCQLEAAMFYADRTGGDMEDMMDLMDEERWLTAEEAEDFGFIDSIRDPFAQEAFEDVKAEIVAAGQWPMALAEMPDIEEDTEDVDMEATQEIVVEEPVDEPEPQEEVDDEDEPDAGTEDDEVQEDEQAIESEDVEGENEIVAEAVEEVDETGDEGEVEQSAYKRGLEDGTLIGRAQVECEYDERSAEWQKKLEDAEKRARTFQADKDKITNQLTDLRAESEQRIMGLRAELEAVTEKLSKHVGGALTFEPTVETWEQAVTALGYEAAVKKHPDLLNSYRAAKRQEG
jgi:ATP-dependent protease ClpP protease subunit